MLDITPLASEKLQEYMKANNISSALRIFINQGGCSGPSLALALDEKKETDKVVEQDGLTFLIDTGVSDQCGAITLDFIDAGAGSGFSIKPEIPLPGGGGCSSGSCGSGGCGC